MDRPAADGDLRARISWTFPSIISRIFQDARAVRPLNRGRQGILEGTPSYNRMERWAHRIYSKRGRVMKGQLSKNTYTFVNPNTPQELQKMLKAMIVERLLAEHGSHRQ